MVVIGVGNEFRRDDGAGPAVVARLRELAPPGVRLVVTDGEPARLIEAWAGAALAVVVDAVRADPPRPGTVHRFEVAGLGTGTGRPASSHGLGLDDAELTRRCEQAIRNYDPCISCSTHFLELTIERAL